MRLLMCAALATALSGCSWFGGKDMHKKSVHPMQAHAGGAYHPCQVFSATQPIPAGCHPSQVTLVMPGQGQQGPGGHMSQIGSAMNVGSNPTHISGGYGSHAYDTISTHNKAVGSPRLKKPKLRGSLSFGLERSVSGTLVDFHKAPNSVDNYDSSIYVEPNVQGTPASGSVTTRSFYSTNEEFKSPDISFDDVYTTPIHLRAGAEYIVSNNMTLFANGGYSYAEGETIENVAVEGELRRLESVQGYTNGVATGAPVVTDTRVPFQRFDVALFDYDFSDFKRYDLEVGGRYYFDPISRSEGYKTVTPFVSAAVGASHYAEQSYKIDQQQLCLEIAYNAPTNIIFYDVDSPLEGQTVYESQWVPTGSLTGGLEWQLTPSTALAFETGLRMEGARDYANGAKGESNISIPLTLRGSVNF